MVTKKITIEPVTRIEGHAKVTMSMSFEDLKNFVKGEWSSKCPLLRLEFAAFALSAIIWQPPKLQIMFMEHSPLVQHPYYVN
jgi:hypothetical protein